MTDRSQRPVQPGKGNIYTFVDCPYYPGSDIREDAGVMEDYAKCGLDDRYRPKAWYCDFIRKTGMCPMGFGGMPGE